MVALSEPVIQWLVTFSLVVAFVATLMAAAIALLRAFIFLVPQTAYLYLNRSPTRRLLLKLSKISALRTMELLFVSLASGGALFALLLYKQTNTFTMLTALEERDRATRALYFSTGGADPAKGLDLLQLFASDPYVVVGTDKSGKPVRESVSVTSYERECTKKTRENIRGWAREVYSKASGHPMNAWPGVEQVYDSIWSLGSPLEKDTAAARMLVMHAIDYLYIVHDAMQAYQTGYFTYNEYRMWEAYLNDMTPNPFFMLALRDGTKFGYLMPEVASGIRDYYLSAGQELNRCVVDALYPAFWSHVTEMERGR